MESVRAKGREGEIAAGIVNKKEKIDSLSKIKQYRIPDELIETETEKILREIKNVSSLSYTSQIKDFNDWAKAKGYKFILVVRDKNTKLSGTILEEIEKGNIELKYIYDIE